MSAAQSTVGEGTVVADRYRLERLLGEGGMGSVWRAVHLVTKKTVAIKFLKPELAANASVVARFLREARAACAVRHPNVVQIHDVIQLPSAAPAMIMDFLEGESLAERLERETRLSVEECARVMMPVISAVAAAHEAGVVHRDLKPDNLFLEKSSDGSTVVKVLDFGVAKVTEMEEGPVALTKTGSMIGTPYYMSPEQLFGERDVDYRTDVWALGIIFYECLTGARPTEAENLGQIVKLVTQTGIPSLSTLAPHVPAPLASTIDRMLLGDRASRLSSLAEVRAALVPIVGPSSPPADGAAAGPVIVQPTGQIRIVPAGAELADTANTPWVATQADAAPAAAPVPAKRVATWVPVLGAVVLASVGVGAFVTARARMQASSGVAPASPAASVEPHTTATLAVEDAGRAADERQEEDSGAAATAAIRDASTSAVVVKRPPSAPRLPSPPVEPAPPRSTPATAPTKSSRLEEKPPF